MRILLIGLLLVAACKRTTTAKVSWKPPEVGSHVIRDRTHRDPGEPPKKSRRDIEVLEVGDGATKISVRFEADEAPVEAYVVTLTGDELAVTAPDGSAVSKDVATRVGDDVREEMGPPSGMMKVLLGHTWTTTSTQLTGDDLAALNVDQGSVRVREQRGSQTDLAVDLSSEIGGGALSATVFIWIKLTVDSKLGRIVKLERSTDLPSGRMETVSTYSVVAP